jgi:hypothetical protein
MANNTDTVLLTHQNSMGHALGIAQGIAIAQKNRVVWCFDGDGAALMHLGSFATSAPFRLSNLRHILINNDAHESVGEQDTVASQKPDYISKNGAHNFVDMASSMGYRALGSVCSSGELGDALKKIYGRSMDAPIFLEVKVALGTRPDLGRPKHSTKDAKEAFMSFLEQPQPNRLPAVNGNYSGEKDKLLLTPGTSLLLTVVVIQLPVRCGSPSHFASFSPPCRPINNFKKRKRGHDA